MSRGQETAGKENSVSWTKTQEDQISALYGSLKGVYQQDANKKLFGGAQLPYEQAHSILVENIKKQEQAEGLEGKVHNESHRVPIKPTQFDYGLGLGGIAAAVVGLASANPVVAAAGILTTMYALTPKYKKVTQKAY
ncbi:MAG: hypothetical protein AABX25_04075 [Nanoarchaeota archaeon]